MKRLAVILGILAAAPVPAHALGHVVEGNQPLGPESGLGPEVLAAVNLPERVYYYHHDFRQTFYFKGGPKALNEAMRRFAVIPADRREIILLPAPPTVRMHAAPADFTWRLCTPGGRTRGKGRDIAIQQAEIYDTGPRSPSTSPNRSPRR